ncbi:Calx-beta domain-containing protein [Pontibacter locisalis]|uniref:Calx-beta domain-containing protein n=1 Tax=Pontibacter locisalis TaxID=1719035 RepID=A0ABW5IK41_9BACT
MKINNYLYSLLAASVGLFLFSCDEEDSSPVPEFNAVPGSVELRTTTGTRDTISVLEDAGSVKIPVDLVSDPIAAPVTVNYTVTGALSATGTAVIPANASSATIEIPIPDNKAIDATRFATVTLTGADNNLRIGRNGRGVTKVIRIRDNIQTISFSTTGATVTEAPNNPIVKIPVTVSNTLRTAVSVAYTVTPVAGNTATNFQVVSPNPLTLQAGVKTDTIRVRIMNNLERNMNNRFEVKITSVTPASADAEINFNTSKSTFTVTVNDDLRTVAFVNEATPQVITSARTVNSEIRLSEPSTRPVTVNYTITGGTAGVDYVDNTGGRLTIPAGATVGNINIEFLNAAFGMNPNKNIRVNLVSVEGEDREVVLGSNNVLNFELE